MSRPTHTSVHRHPLRTLFKALATIVALLLLAVGGALAWLTHANLAPFALAQLQQRTGLTVTAAGPLTLKLWPAIQVQASQVSVPALQGGGPLLTVADASLKAHWGAFPFIWRGLAVDDLTLTDPSLTLVQFADGTGNWSAAAPARPVSASALPAGGTLASPLRLPVGSFGHVTIRNLNATWHNRATGQQLTANNINLLLDATDLTHPSARLTGSLNHQPLSGAIATVLSNDNKNLSQVPVQASLTIAGLVATANGHVSPRTRAFAGQVSAKTNNLNSTLAALLGQAPHGVPTAPLAFSTTLAYHDNTVKLNDFHTEIGSVLRANGSLSATLGGLPRFTGTLSATGTNLAAAAGAFGLADKNLPAAPFSFATQLSGQGAITLTKLRLSLPNLLETQGTLTYTPASGPTAKPDLTADLTFTRLNLDRLGLCQAPPAVSLPQTANVAAPPAATGTPWSDNALNTGALGTATFTLKTAATGITCARAPLTAFAATLANTAQTLTIQALTATIGGGSIKAAGTLGHSGTPALKLNLTTGKLPLEELVATLKQRGIVLPLDITAAVTATGNSTRQLAAGLAGSLQVAATSGRVPYTNLAGQVGTLIQGGLKAGLQAAQNGAGNASGVLESLNADYTISQGILNTDRFALRTDGGSTRLVGTGTINLPQWTVAYRLTPTVGGPSSTLAVPLLVRGALTSPAIGPDPAFVAKLAGRLAAQGLKSLLGMGKAQAKGLGNALDTLLGGAGPAASGTTAAPATPGKKGLSADDVNSLVNGLFH